MRTDIARVLRFINPLECFSSVPVVELSGNGRSEYSKIPLGGRTARAVAHPLGRMGFCPFLWFSSVLSPGLGSGLDFPTFLILNCKFLSGALPLETPPGALPLGTPRAVSADRPHFLIVAPYTQIGP